MPNARSEAVMPGFISIHVGSVATVCLVYGL